MIPLYYVLLQPDDGYSLILPIEVNGVLPFRFIPIFVEQRPTKSRALEVVAVEMYSICADMSFEYITYDLEFVEC